MRSFVLNRTAFVNRIALAVLCAVTVWLAGCASSKPAVEPAAAKCVAGATDAGAVDGAASAANAGVACAPEAPKLDSLRAKMAITLVDQNGKEQNLDAVLFSVPGKRYRMELTGPMGIGVASLLWQEEGWTMTFPTEKLYMKGAGYMVGLFGEPSIPTVNIHQVAALFKGTLLPEGYEEVEPPGDSTRVEGVTYAREKTGRSFTFAKEGPHVAWLSRMGGDGKPETIRYFDFREFEGVEMPERIVFERGGAKYLEIRVKKVARGKSFSPGTWRLTVPRSYKAVGE